MSAESFRPAHELLPDLDAKSISSTELTEIVLAHIAEHEPDVNCLAYQDPERARAEAAAATERRSSSGPEGRLDGLPLTIKDLTDTAGIPTSYGSVKFKDHVPEVDGLVWERVKAENPVFLGKTTTPEFGFLGITENDLTGVTRNPWSLDRTVGGSSGGAAAAVAAGYGPVATGSDGGGSIRMPAACCGVVGLKASRGRIPSYGEDDPFALADTPGPLARCVKDVGILLDVLAGPDRRDPLSLPAAEIDWAATADEDLAPGLRIAFCPDLGTGPIQAAVATAVEAAANVFETDLRAHVSPVAVDIPDPVELVSKFWRPAIATLLDTDLLGADPEKIHPVIRRLGEEGRSVSAIEQWDLMVTKRQSLHDGIAAVFSDYDLLITPTMPMTAYRHPGDVGGPTEVDGKEVEFPFYYPFRFTMAFNHTGHPAITLPCGFDEDGLPVGLQIVGNHHDEASVLRAAAAFERATDWSERRPFWRRSEAEV